MSRDWIYPTENARKEYKRALETKQKIEDIYSEIADLKSQIEIKNQEIKFINTAEPNYVMFFFMEMINSSKAELINQIKGVKRLIALKPDNKFQIDRLKTLEDLLKTKI